MPTAERGVLQEVNDQLDSSVRAVSQALEAGKADPSLLRDSRRQAEAGMARLRDLAASAGPAQPGAHATMQHLDILISLIDSVDAAPELARKLAAHLLEEQAAEGAAAPPEPQDRVSPSTPSGSLPGGRRPLSVGSLIGR